MSQSAFKNLLITILFSFIFFSCRKDSTDFCLLQRAQEVVEYNPKLAQTILDSISNPIEIGQDRYMQYVIASARARAGNKQNFDNDTLIIKAKEYFEQQRNWQQAAFANLHSASIYRKQNYWGKASECFYLAKQYAELSGDELTMGKAYHSIGNLFFKKGTPDSSIYYFRMASKIFKKYNKPIYSANTIGMLGVCHYNLNNIDSAYFYLEHGFKYTTKIGHQDYITKYHNYLGLALRLKKEYDQAEFHLKKALLEYNTAYDSLRVSLSLGYLYQDLHKTDSLTKYALYLKNNLESKANNNLYLLRDGYDLVASYYQHIQDYKNALLYSQKSLRETTKIEDNKRLEAILQSDKEASTVLKNQEAHDPIGKFTFYSLPVILSITIIILMIKEMRKSIKIQKEERNLEQKMISLRLEYIGLKAKIYKQLENQLSDDEKIKFNSLYGSEDIPRKLKEIALFTYFQSKEKENIWIENTLLQQPYGESVITKLSRCLQFALAMYLHGYSENEVSINLRIPFNEMPQYKEKLKIELASTGLSEDQINHIFRQT